LKNIINFFARYSLIFFFSCKKIKRSSKTKAHYDVVVARSNCPGNRAPLAPSRGDVSLLRRRLGVVARERDVRGLGVPLLHHLFLGDDHLRLEGLRFQRFELGLPVLLPLLSFHRSSLGRGEGSLDVVRRSRRLQPRRYLTVVVFIIFLVVYYWFSQFQTVAAASSVKRHLNSGVSASLNYISRPVIWSKGCHSSSRLPAFCRNG